MKRLLYILFLLPFLVNGQAIQYQGVASGNYGWRGLIHADSGFAMHPVTTLGTGRYFGHMKVRTDGTQWFWTGTTWQQMGGATGPTYGAGYAINITGGIIRVDTVFIPTKAWVNNQIASIPAPSWTAITGKPSTFPTTLAQIGQSGAITGQVPQWNGSSWVPANVSAGGDTTGKGLLTRDAAAAQYATQDSLNAKNARVNQRIDNLPSGGTSNDKSTDSAFRAKNLSIRTPELFMRRIYNLPADSGYFAKSFSGFNEFDIYPAEPWNPKSNKIYVSTDGGQDGRIMLGYLDTVTWKFVLTPRTLAQWKAGFADIPTDSTMEIGGVYPSINTTPRRYASMFVSPFDSLIYYYSYNQAEETFVQWGRYIKDVRACPPLSIGALNDIHVRPNPNGEVSAIAKSVPDGYQFAILNAKTPRGPFVKQSLIERPNNVDMQYALIKFADPSIFFEGGRAYITWTSNNFKYRSLWSYPVIQEITNNVGMGRGLVSQKGKAFAMPFLYPTNPVYLSMLGKQYMVWARNADNSSGGAGSGSFGYDDYIDTNLYSIIQATELPDDVENRTGRMDTGIVQIVAGNRHEVISNALMAPASGVINTKRGIVFNDDSKGLWGGTNEVNLIDFDLEIDFKIDRIPTTYSTIFQARSTDDVNPVRIKAIVDSATRVGIQIDYADGTTRREMIPADTSTRYTLQFTSNGSVRLNYSVIQQPNLPRATLGKFMGLYSLGNDRIDTIPAGHQFYGKVYSVNMYSLAPPDYVNATGSPYTVTSNRRRVKVSNNVPATYEVYLPTAGLDPSVYTGIKRGDEYEVVNTDGNEVRIYHPTLPGGFIRTTNAGESVRLAYGMEGYSVLTHNYANPTITDGTYTNATVKIRNGQIIDIVSGAVPMTDARVLQIADSIAIVRSDSITKAAIAAFAAELADTTVYEPEALAILDSVKSSGYTVRMSDKQYIQRLVKGFKDSAIWTKERLIAPLIGNTEASQSWCFKNGVVSKLINTGTLTRDAMGVYFTTSGTGTVNTGYVIADNGHNTSHSVGMSYYSRSNNVTSGYEMGEDNASPNFMIISYVGGQQYGQAFANLVLGPTPTDTRGLFGFSRVAGRLAIFNRGVVTASNSGFSATGTSSTPNPVFLGAAPPEFSGKTCAYASIHELMSDDDMRKEYNIVQSALTIINRQIP